VKESENRRASAEVTGTAYRVAYKKVEHIYFA